MVEVADGLADRCPDLIARYMVGKPTRGYDSWEEALASQPNTPLAEQSECAMMLYSSGTTGRPKGVKHPLRAPFRELPRLCVPRMHLHPTQAFVR